MDSGKFDTTPMWCYAMPRYPGISIERTRGYKMADNIERTVVSVRGVAQPLGAYNQAVSVRPGRLLFIAGQVGIDEAGNVVGKGTSTPKPDRLTTI